MTNKFKTREEWLQAFTAAARPVFKSHGYKIPDNVRLSVGFTSKGARSKRIGECWASTYSEDGAWEIFITPNLGDAARIADVLTHELVHVVVGIEVGHKKPFRKCATAVGLTGKMTATVAGTVWWEWAQDVLDDLGPLPHATLKRDGPNDKKQGTRMLKCTCDACGFTMRTTSKWLKVACAGLRCPNLNCGGDVTVA